MKMAFLHGMEQAAASKDSQLIRAIDDCSRLSYLAQYSLVALDWTIVYIVSNSLYDSFMPLYHIDQASRGIACYQCG
jgi:hypothetical protein